ncbi:MAG: YncE family protein, partial [Chloroflexi bacterium]
MVGLHLPKRVLVLAAAASLAVGGTTAMAVHILTAGPQGDGSSVTPNGWFVTPAGRQIDLADATWWADRPYGEALSPDGHTLLISSAGQSTESIKVVDTASGTVRQTIAYTAPEAINVGVVWSPRGDRAFASAGGNNKVRTYGFDGSRLTESGSIAVPNYPMGLAIASDGLTLYAAENRGDALAVIDLATASVESVAVGACDEQGSPVQYPPSAPQCQPYGVTLAADGSTAYVSNWGEHSVTPISTRTRTALAKIQVGTHPNALATNPKLARHQVVVANGDSDTLSVIDTASNTVVQTINLAPYPNAPEGSNPNALAMAPDGNTLYVANAGNNDVDVVRFTGPRPVVGMLPTAWYPTAVDVSPDGQTLYVANAKGLGAGPNPEYVQGAFGPPNQYVGSMMHGTLQIVRVPSGDQLDKYSAQVIKNNGFDERDQVRENGSGGGVIPRRVGEPS